MGGGPLVGPFIGLTGGDTVRLHLALTHRHGLGALTPYFRGLLAGRALASRCRVCARSWFPPRFGCPEHGATLDWAELQGAGRVVALTHTAGVLPFGVGDGAAAPAAAPLTFALVALDGAHNLAFARLDGSAAQHAVVGDHVWLSRAAGEWPHPAQAACFVGSEAERVRTPLSQPE